MCGLIAAIDDIWTDSTNAGEGDIPLLNDYDKGPQDNHVLTSSTSILAHRGPDGMTVSSGIMGSNKARWSMGHTRLAIVDPNNRQADMPFELEFKSNSKVVKLAANGEIYNHEKIYEDLVTEDNWPHSRISGSDCEVIAHSVAKHGGPATAKKLDGMFAFVVFEENLDDGSVTVFAARDPVGIKPLYYGIATDSEGNSGYIFSSELKALVGHVDPSSIVAIPPGHYWTPDSGLVCYYNPDWLRKDDFAPWKTNDHHISDEKILEEFTNAVEKRMMADVNYGFFLSGGVDSAIVAHVLMPLYRNSQLSKGGEICPIPTFTVGMENSPDVMAAKAVVESLGGSKYIDHKIRYFTADEVFDTIPKIIRHMETYEAELIRSSIPNWFLAEHAAKDVKMVLTGEGSDELFAGYLYFKDAENSIQVQNELRRIYGMLGNINLHRTDRMTMAHGLEARVPFLDTKFTKLIMSVDPEKKIVDPKAVENNTRGREKTFLRELYEGPNANGDSLPRPVLWRAKAMQCEGVGEDWVSILQSKIEAIVSDKEMDEAASKYPLNSPQTKEELYYRKIFEENYPDMAHVVKLWEGGGRAMGAEWKSDMYSRKGLANVNLLSHSLQEPRKESILCATKSFSRMRSKIGFSSKFSRISSRLFSSVTSEPSVPIAPLENEAINDAYSRAKELGYSDFEAWLTSGGDERNRILPTGCNKYHIKPQPIPSHGIFRGSCTGSPITSRGYKVAAKLYQRITKLGSHELDSELKNIFSEQRFRLLKFLDLPEGTAIILVPSGSDAEYLPVAIARSLNPKKKIVNIVTQLNEIGAGSAPAAGGQYFSTCTPLVERVTVGSYLDGFDSIGTCLIDAREKNGEVIDASKITKQISAEAIEKGIYPIIHGVFGGKTGICDNNMPSSLNAGDNSLGVIDACQGRFTKEELHQWLNQDSLVIFTASKFYQAPPFCGAIIIPKRVAEKLTHSQPPIEMLSSNGIGGFITDKELPIAFKKWFPFLSNTSNNNLGLALRWEAGLASMEAISSIDEDQKQIAVTRWVKSIEDMVNGEAFLDTWCIEKSIVSVRIAKNNGWLNMEEARDLYRWMSMDVSSIVEHTSIDEQIVLSIPAYIGQPVNVSESHAIVRIALGVESLLSFIEDGNATLEEDFLIVKKLATLGKYFDILKNSDK